MLKYKLTDRSLRTREGHQWQINEKQVTDGIGGICGPGWLHYYHDPLVAMFMASIHVDFTNFRLWEVEAEGQHVNDRNIKGACTELTIVQEIDLPIVTTTQRVAFGILCAKQVYSDPNWSNWANKWLSGEDRTYAAARAARADAAYAARTAAYAADAADATDAAAYAGYAGYAADAADAATGGASINITSIAHQAMGY